MMLLTKEASTVLNNAAYLRRDDSAVREAISRKPRIIDPGFVVIRLQRDRFAIRGSDRRKNHGSASIFAAAEYEMPLKSSGFRMKVFSSRETARKHAAPAR
jgi:hypothetical protein